MTDQYAIDMPDGTRLVAAPAPVLWGCSGCWGNDNTNRCDALPEGCASYDIVWVERTEATGAVAALMRLKSS